MGSTPPSRVHTILGYVYASERKGVYRRILAGAVYPGLLRMCLSAESLSVALCELSFFMLELGDSTVPFHIQRAPAAAQVGPLAVNNSSLKQYYYWFTILSVQFGLLCCTT